MGGMKRRDLLRTMSASLALFTPTRLFARQPPPNPYDERKLLTVDSGTLGPLSSSLLLDASQGSAADAPEALQELCAAILRATHTPDITEPATVSIYGRDLKTAWRTPRVYKFPVGYLFAGTAPCRLSGCLLETARENMLTRVPPPGDGTLSDHCIELIQKGALEYELGQLGHVLVSFFYYGPEALPSSV